MTYYLERIQHGVDFIEAHLDESITLSDVASKAGISQWHFQRIFKALTGDTLKSYIRARRLALSLDRLLTTELRILDIALLAGFESQEAYARAFKGAFGVTPSFYRDERSERLFLKKPRFDAEYLKHIHENVSLEPEILEQPKRIFVGMRTLFFGVDSEKNNIGEKLPPLWSAFLPRVAEIEHRVAGALYGVVRQNKVDSDELEYHAAALVTEVTNVPDGTARFELPQATYATFTHRGPAPELNRTVDYIYSTWLAQSRRRHAYGADIETYGAGYDPTSPNSVIGYAIPIG